jgi:hypothetical protein
VLQTHVEQLSENNATTAEELLATGLAATVGLAEQKKRM